MQEQRSVVRQQLGVFSSDVLMTTVFGAQEK